MSLTTERFPTPVALFILLLSVPPVLPGCATPYSDDNERSETRETEAEVEVEVVESTEDQRERRSDDEAERRSDAGDDADPNRRSPRDPGLDRPQDPGKDPRRSEAIPAHEAFHAVQVKFNEGLSIRLGRDGVLYDRGGKAFGSQHSQDLLERAGKLGTWGRSHPFVSEAQLDEWRAKATKQLGVAPADLNLYYNLLLEDPDQAEAVARAFREMKEVEHARVMPTYYLTEAPDYAADRGTFVANGFELEYPYQKYLEPAPVGVDAYYAWNWSYGGAGADVTVLDIEYGFDTQHEDLPEVLVSDIFLIEPDLAPRSLNHGTSTLSVIGGVENGFGVTGIAHDAQLAFSPPSAIVAFGLQAAVGLDGFITGSIISNEMEAGDVIVLELQIAGPLTEFPDNPNEPIDQFGMLPVEWFQPNWDTIRTVTANGYVVVAGGGNGHQNLDDPLYQNSDLAPHDPFAMDRETRLNDSGAIIVGAGFSGADWSNYALSNPNQRHGYSNHGGRVDVHAWGDAVVTAGPGNPATTPIYEGSEFTISDDYGALYSGTSSATAIIGGVAGAMQGWHKSWWDGATLTSREMREVMLIDATPQFDPQNGKIGPMPNLRGMIEALVGDAPTPTEPIGEPFDNTCPGLPEEFEPFPYCGTDLEFPAPTFSIRSGVLDIDTTADLYLFMEDSFSLSGTIFYTLDGATPLNCLEENGSLSCGGSTRAWTRNHLRFCSPIQITHDMLPLTVKALSTTALCAPRVSSAVRTAVFVPPGYILKPLFDKPTTYDLDLSIAMQSQYLFEDPNAEVVMVYTLDGSTPVYYEDPGDGPSSAIWTDALHSAGNRIQVFANAPASGNVTFKARNYLKIDGVWVGGEVETHVFPAP